MGLNDELLDTQLPLEYAGLTWEYLKDRLIGRRDTVLWGPVFQLAERWEEVEKKNKTCGWAEFLSWKDKGLGSCFSPVPSYFHTRN